MAGDWIKMRTNLWDDPRVSVIGSVTQCNKASVTGALFRLWSLADEHTENGTFPYFTGDILDQQVGIDGFAEALKSVGWLDETDDGLQIPRFDEHNSKSAKQRALTSKRVANHRAKETPDKRKGATPALQPRYLEAEKSKNKNKRLSAGAGLQNLNQRSFREADLHDDGKIAEVFELITSGKQPLVNKSEQNLLWLFSVACHCIDASKRPKNPVEKPVGLFLTLIQSGDRSCITQSQEDAAVARVKRLRSLESQSRPQSEPQSKSAEDLAAQLPSPEDVK